ncbi:MAG: tandem-95 repeat protein [Magnetococcales bacterium]|nr:tandem-95 repeat protein [Magnetococcales bacterium]
MQSKKLFGVVSALFLAALASACGGGGGGGSGDGSTSNSSAGATSAGTTSGTTANNTNTVTTTPGLSGTAANGLALPNAKVTLQTARGDTKEVGTTDAKGQFSGVTLPDSANFPVILSVTLPNGKDVLRSIIPSLKSTTTTTNINPITQAITSQVLPAGTSLSSLDVSDGATGFASKAKTVVQAALGDAVDYDTFASKPMQARTADNPKAGGLADTLIDTIAGMDATRKPEDILASAADPKDPAVAKSLMANPAFQARLAGELVAQGRQAGDVTTMIQSEAATGANTAQILTNTQTFATSFQSMYSTASTELTGSDAQKQAALESIVQSAAITVAKIVDKKGVTSGDSLTNVVTNSMSLVQAPLVAIAKTNQGGANLSLIVEATRDQMSDLITSSTVDLTKSSPTVATLGMQVKNFGEIVSSAVAGSLNSGKDKSGLDDKAKLLVATNMGKGVASSLTTFLSDLAVDKSAMTDAQKANLNKAQNTAKNAATALDSALVGMATNQTSGTLGSEVVNSMAQALVTQASETLKKYDLTLDSSAFSGAAINVLTNMATLVVNNAAAFHASAATLDTDKQAALTGAMAQQLFSEVKNLDLTGDAPPDTALRVATNMAQAMGPALVEKVGQASTYQGSNLLVLASSVIANATTQLKQTTDLTGSIDTVTLSVLQQSASQSADTSRTNMEATFKRFEDQGVALADVTAGVAGAGLAGNAMDTVLTQIQSTMATGGDVMKLAARDIAETAGSMAQAVLQKGGTLAQVQTAVASPLAAMGQAAAGQAGQNSSDILSAILNSANTLEQAVQVLSVSQNMSLDTMILTAGNVAAIAGTGLGGDASDQLLSTIRDNSASGAELKLDTLAGQLAQFDPTIMAKATQQQAAIQDQAKVILKATDILPQFIPFANNPLVEVGQVFTGLLPIKDDQTGKSLTFKIVANGNLGTATITDPKTGAFSYQPNPDATGIDTFSFVINDGIGETQPISVAITVVDKLPDFVPPSLTMVARIGQPITGVLPIVNAQPGVALTFKIVSQGSKGTATITDPATGAFSYLPNPGSTGLDTFSFNVSDGVGTTPPMPMTIQVANPLPEFQPPANDIIAEVSKPFVGLLPIKDVPPGTTLTFKIVANAQKGTVTLNNATTGAFTYQPNPGAIGPDTFSFTVNDGVGETPPIPMTIQVVNPPPTPILDAVWDQAIWDTSMWASGSLDVQAGKPITGFLPVNNPDGDPLTYKIVTQGTKGVVTITDPIKGAFIYQPNPGGTGPDSFTFIVNDGIGDSAPIVVPINVFNKPPVFIPPANPMAVSPGQTFNGILPVGNDQSGKTLVFKIVDNGKKGTVTITNPATGAFSYQANPGTSGPDTFTIAINDGYGETMPISVTMQITNNPPNPVSDAVWDQATWDSSLWASGSLDVKAGQPISGFLPVNNPDGDPLTYKIVTQGTKGVVTITDPIKGAFIYQPNPGGTGPDSFSFVVNDGFSDSTPIMVPINVFNKPPEFVPPANPMAVFPSKTFNGLLPIGNDQSGKTLSFSIVDNGKKGTVTITNPATGAFSYQANPGTSGSDTFTFSVNDGYGVTPPATMTMQIVNNPPMPVVDAVWDQATWDADKWTFGSLNVIPGQVLSGFLNVNNPDGDPLIYQIVTQATKGTVVITNPATGAFTYTPTAGAYTAIPDAYGPDSFTFKVNDGIADSPPVTVSVTINAAPIVQAGADATGFAKGTFNLGGNITDQNGSGDILSYSWTQVSGPPVTINNAATITAAFTLPTVTTATDLVFKLTATDREGASSSSTTKVTVYPEDIDANRKISVSDVSVTEGDAGTTNAVFTITLDYPSTRTISVQYNTGDDTATVGSDYTFTNGTVTFAPGETSKTVSVPIFGDTLDEGNETFKLLLHTVSGAVIVKDTGVGTIVDDDTGKGAVWDHAIWDTNSWL